MRIDVAIDYKKDEPSRGSAAGIMKNDSFTWYFTIRLEDVAVIVNFINQPEENDVFFIAQNQAKVLIVKEYLRLCVLNGKSFLHSESFENEDEAHTDAASRSLLNICVDGLREADIYGRIYTAYAEGPVRFRGTPSLVLQMERIYDEISFPMSATQHRRFQNKERPDPKDTEKGMYDLTKHDISDKKGEIATFIVKVTFRQNATWQGTVTWVDEKKKHNFRSALELIRLIDSASCENSAGI